MARLSEGLLDRFKRLVGGGKRPPDPLAPIPLGQSGNKVGRQGGHRGMAFGRVGTGKEDVSPENRARWEKLRDSEAGDFTYNGAILYVHSSNVQSAQYDIESQTLLVAYLPKKNSAGAIWQYDPISEDEAIAFANAHSKGSFLWDVVRVRGTRHGHKVNARRVA
jgi:hypothetical protein